MKKILLLFTTLLSGIALYAQYAAKHYIAPSPWQYWSDANEIVISTKVQGQVTVTLSKSDGTVITTLTITSAAAVSYRFQGSPAAALRNSANIVYADRGLIVTATAPVLVNLRNIASDSDGTGTQTIKGNASLVSFGNEGIGTAFRLGYYRTNYTGISSGAPIYSVMAIEDNTRIAVNEVEFVTLNAGESTLFYTGMGALLTASKPVVANTGTYGDTPQACSGSGEDGAVDQIAPVNQLGLQYMLVRGNGTAGTGPGHPEQSTIIASEPGTAVQITNYTPDGVEISTSSQTIADAGGFINLFHGDAQNEYSSTLVTADKPVIVYSASAVGCETDISTVLPIGGCSGSNNISTRKFIDYSGDDLPYFGYVILESPTNIVYVNGQDMEEVTGIPRIQIGSTGFYMLRFTNLDIGTPDNIAITSQSRLTTSIIQQGSGFSMSGFFSAFSNAPDVPQQQVAGNCAITLATESGLEPYAWYLDGILIPDATGATIAVQQTGNYTVSGTAECGITQASAPVYAVAWPPIAAGTAADMVQCSDGGNAIVFNLTAQDNAVLSGQGAEDYTVTYHTTQEDAESKINEFSEMRTAANIRVFARITNNSAGCYAISSFNLVVSSPEITMPSAYTFCSGSYITITAPPGFLTYSWSTGETTQSINAGTAGTITLTVTQESNGVICGAAQEITVKESAPPIITDVFTGDWSLANNTISVVPDNEGDFEFSIDGKTYQDSSFFSGLEPGAYTVYARDKNGCGSTRFDVYLLMYPNFFTPNGDGIHEQWRVQYSYLEPEMLVHIFDRYGRLLTTFNGLDGGWDGTFNGSNLPATDYWFLVKRTDGKIHKGHFTLKR